MDKEFSVIELLEELKKDDSWLEGDDEARAKIIKSFMFSLVEI
ncbi:hypothetical protein OXPF_42630 [Oxobacter pfennigii]|uniref:Uncharacterized protein n=1 Tax=Oxobacter pfennigii TaxID=36849 RepID=A0A0P8YS56_9CLOT|nr:hypothetical protein [Oxobacter pfennigii]KPU42478.1 hypothetical protein OXPF_42630 [Oxobacter pfennigii]